MIAGYVLISYYIFLLILFALRSPNEKKIIRNPQELDNSYSAYEENPAKNSGTNSQV